MTGEPTSTPTNSLKDAITYYQDSLNCLKSTLNCPELTSDFPKIVGVMVARDTVERIRQAEGENPSGKEIADLISSDAELKSSVLATKIIKYKDRLREAKEDLNIPATNWWWRLTDVLPDIAIEEYGSALGELERNVEQSHKNSEQSQNEKSNKVRKVLLVRDAIEKFVCTEKQLPPEKIDKILELDDRLWKLSSEIAQVDNNDVDKWNVIYKPPQFNWWWQIASESPYFFQCVDRFRDALTEVDNAVHDEGEVSEVQCLKLLKARDALEKALKKQPSVPEEISRRIVKYDQKLLENWKSLIKGKRLAKWKKSLNPPESNWWWNFKPTLFDEQDVPLAFTDRLWIILAVGCLGIAAGFVVSTAQTFQSGAGGAQSLQSATSNSKDKGAEVIRPDALQTSAVILQGASLVALSAGAVTKKGQKIIDDLINSLDFIPSTWRAQTTFGLSLIALGVAYSVHENLPKLGNWYFTRGQKLQENGDLYKAQEQYQQAKKFFTDPDDKAKLGIAAGELYEQRGRLDLAISEYANASTTDDSNILNHLGRAMLFKELREAEWTEKPIKESVAQQIEAYFQQVENNFDRQGSKTLTSNSDIDHQQIQKQININKGILTWSRINWGKINFQNLTDKDKDSLANAVNSFRLAAEQEDKLPTTVDGRIARCYSELAMTLTNPEKVVNLPLKKANDQLNNANDQLKKANDQLNNAESEWKNKVDLNTGKSKYLEEFRKNWESAKENRESAKENWESAIKDWKSTTNKSRRKSINKKLDEAITKLEDEKSDFEKGDVTKKLEDVTSILADDFSLVFCKKISKQDTNNINNATLQNSMMKFLEDRKNNLN